MSLARCVCWLQRAGKKILGTRHFGAIMPVDLSGWGGSLNLPEVEDKPAQPLRVRYGSVEIEELGQILTPTQVVRAACAGDVPLSSFWAGAGAFAQPLLKLGDPRPIKELGNAPLCRIQFMGLKKGFCFLFCSCAFSGLHRYVWLVYEQSQQLTCNEPTLSNRSGDKRGNFKILAFRKKYKLPSPVAGTCFQAEWDDYVPKLYEQLSGK
ncbi:PREDICTED: phosphatidylethanolamine-binding protein 1 [Thamnophis sirtalis]|uniref:Phosphatidylethanolamine-binding protein 1 n=1 Tax=Thamnophis sirtalis TaxID=35019 RepID=A0A6I9XYF3_9SAUR|nr:PREDICTED: phosphatidylethanolamine-binding protein 1 [Thamnophis sirtalis]